MFRFLLEFCSNGFNDWERQLPASAGQDSDLCQLRLTSDLSVGSGSSSAMPWLALIMIIRVYLTQIALKFSSLNPTRSLCCTELCLVLDTYKYSNLC
jgi:hypothetical protein